MSHMSLAKWALDMVMSVGCSASTPMQLWLLLLFLQEILSKISKTFLAKHDGATGSGTHPAHWYNLVSTCPLVQQQGRLLLFDQPFTVSKMQRRMQGAQGLHIQASGKMDLYMEHPKRKQSCSEHVQWASVSPCISFNLYWPACMICVQWRIHEFKLPGMKI